MLYQPVRPPFWRRHPWITGAAAIFACWLLIHGLYVLVAVIALGATLSRMARHRRDVERRNADLRARADYEHRLNLLGDPRGVYGRYPPVQAGWFPDPIFPQLLRYFDGTTWTTLTVPR